MFTTIFLCKMGLFLVFVRRSFENVQMFSWTLQKTCSAQIISPRILKTCTHLPQRHPEFRFSGLLTSKCADILQNVLLSHRTCTCMFFFTVSKTQVSYSGCNTIVTTTSVFTNALVKLMTTQNYPYKSNRSLCNALCNWCPFSPLTLIAEEGF